MTDDLDKAIRAVREAMDKSPPWLDDCAEMFAKAALRSLAEPSEEVIEAMATSITGERFRRGWNLPGDRRGKKATALDEEMARAAHAALFKHLLGEAQVEAT